MKKIIEILLMAVAGMTLADGTVTVTGVTAQQRYPCNGKVDIVVTIRGDTDEIALTECTFVATNCATQAAVPVTAISQVGSDTVSGDVCTRRYLWNATNDVGAVKIDDLALTVDAQRKLGGVQLWENGPYWAECNVGASKPEEYGYYFWWGDTVGYKRNASNNGWVSVKDGSAFDFDSSNCPTYGEDNSALRSLGYIDSTGILVAAYDAATANFGAPWRMPTDDEMDELINSCDSTWTTRNGVAGRLVTGRGAFASKSIFLPAAGSNFADPGSEGVYWCSTPTSASVFSAWSLHSYAFDIYLDPHHRDPRYRATTVRPLRGFAEQTVNAMGNGISTHLKLDFGYIRNVTARQLWPHKKVEVRYDLAEDIGEVAGEDTALKLMGKYGSTTKTATVVAGDVSCVAGSRRVVWDLESQYIEINQSAMTFTVAYGSVSGTSEAIAVNTSSTVKDGMFVGPTMTLGYSPIDAAEAVIEIDGEEVLSATNGGSFVWQPVTKGTHTITHIAGDNVWTRTVNVTSLVYEEPTPEDTTPDENVTVQKTEVSVVAKGQTISIGTGGTGTREVSTAEEWITIPAAYASRPVGIPVMFSVAENKGVEERTGFVYVSGHVITITQAGVGATLDGESADFETDGGTGTFTVLAGVENTWRARANVDWISVETLVGTGECAVVYTVAPYNAVTTRSGTITAGGQTFTVNQTGRRMSVSPVTISVDWQSYTKPIAVEGLASTSWGVGVDATWLSIVSAGSGKAGGTVVIGINENPSYVARSGQVFVGTETVTVTQSGRPTAALAFSIAPEESTGAVKGANAVIGVTATPDLPWTAKSLSNWLTVLGESATGSGNGNVVYSISPNPTLAARTGTLSVTPDPVSGLASRVHTVNQPAATALISATEYTFDAAGESYDVQVSTDDVVGWTIAENCDWVSIEGTTSRTGPGTVHISAAANPSVDGRETSVTIAGHVFKIVQPGRSVTVDYEAQVYGTEGTGDDVEIHPDGGVSWKAVVSDPTWISLWGDENCDWDADYNVIGTGDATLSFYLTDYTGDGLPRTGTITIGDQVIYVTQRAYEASVDPIADEVDGNAGEGEVGLSADLGAVWEAIATEPWITVITTNGTGSGTVRYTFTENDTGKTRTGKIIIAGEEYTLTQAARQHVTITASIAVEGGAGEIAAGTVTGAGVYDLGASVTLTATPADGYEFVGWQDESGNAVGDGTPTLPVTASVDRTYVARFAKIAIYVVNGEIVRKGTSRTFTAPAPVVYGGTTQVVCRGTSAFPDMGTNFTVVATSDISFTWDLWATNYWVGVVQSEGGVVTAKTVASGAAGVRALPGWVEAGGEIEMTATPEDGMSFYRWTVDAIVPIASVAENKSSLDAIETIASTGGGSRLTTRVSCPLVVSAIFGIFADTIAQAVDAPSLTFTTGGDANWVPVIDATAQTGLSSVASGAIGAECETWLETTVVGAGTLSFRWRVDCEHDPGGGATWDRATVFTNGVETVRLDGTTDWQTVTLPLTESKTTVRWSFYRDDHDEPNAAFSNRAWVDGIEFEAQELGGVQLWENGPYWSECNVGATKPEEYGYYFWWGDTIGYKRNANDNGWVSVKDGLSFAFEASNCPTYIKDNSSLRSLGYIDSTGNLVAAHDAATAHLGVPWRLPTDAEMSALINNCDTTWTMRNGVAGRLVTGRGAFASKSIFLPAAGLGYGSGLGGTGSDGSCWSSTPRSDYSVYAWNLRFASGYFYRYDCSGRYGGRSVRPLRGFAK